MALVRVKETDSGGEFSILNLQMVTRVECRKFDKERDEHQATVFFADGASVVLVGAEAHRVMGDLEDFAGYRSP